MRLNSPSALLWTGQAQVRWCWSRTWTAADFRFRGNSCPVRTVLPIWFPCCLASPHRTGLQNCPEAHNQNLLWARQMSLRHHWSPLLMQTACKPWSDRACRGNDAQPRQWPCLLMSKSCRGCLSLRTFLLSWSYIPALQVCVPHGLLRRCSLPSEEARGRTSPRDNSRRGHGRSVLPPSCFHSPLLRFPVCSGSEVCCTPGQSCRGSSSSLQQSGLSSWKWCHNRWTSSLKGLRW